MPDFAGPEDLAAALASDVADSLRRRLMANGVASLAVSGGTTPMKFFAGLARQKLDWARVTITLVDDRCVPESSERSNARLVRAHLLQHEAAAAVFLPLVDAGEDAIQALPLPFAAVVLGMGNDGHTASFFPGGDHLRQALAGPQLIETMRAPGAAEPRVTLTLPVLNAADFIAIHIEGPEKQNTLHAAMQPGDVEKMPVRAVLARQPAPIIYWCP